MIQTILFDFDGTLVNTEHLKAVSYASAASELDPTIRESDVLNAYKELVGLTREAIGAALVARFNLAQAAGGRMNAYAVKEPEDAYIALRISIYDQMLSDGELVRSALWPYTRPLLQWAKNRSRNIGLATMSHRPHAYRLLDFLDLSKMFDTIATREDVSRGKPDPEIYHLVAERLAARAEECLVIEDSPAGVKAAINAGMRVLAVCTAYTREAIYASGLLPDAQIIDDPSTLIATASEFIAQLRD